MVWVSQGTAYVREITIPRSYRMAEKHDPLGYLWGATMILVSLASIADRVIRYVKSGRVLYAITNQRVLRLDLHPSGTTIKQSWGDKKRFEFIKSGRGSLSAGYVWLARTHEGAGWIFFFWRRYWKDGLVGLEDPREPYRILLTHASKPKPK